MLTALKPSTDLVSVASRPDPTSPLAHVMQSLLLQPARRATAAATAAVATPGRLPDLMTDLQCKLDVFI
jgi:hypothetical protein